MGKERNIWLALLVICVISFGILGSLGSDIYQQAPPIPDKVIGESGKLLYTKHDIEQGQLVWRSMGGHQTGSIWGHGSYLAPDWNADWLHREGLALLDIFAMREYQRTYEQLSDPRKASVQVIMQKLIRKNTFELESRTIFLSKERETVLTELQQHYSRVFGDYPDYQPLREQYALKENAIPSAQNRHLLSGFLFWSTWATITERPGKSISYTSNWPYDPLVGNTPSGSLLGWSLLSIVLLIGGIGALVWYHATLKHESLPKMSKSDPLAKLKLTPSQKATGKYFLVAVALFGLQILLGGITAHYAVEGQDFYGIPLSEILPYSVTRTWHTQLAVFWIATVWLGTGLFIAPALTGKEPKYQRFGVNLLFIALVVVVLGSMAGEWLGVQQVFDLDTNYWFGHQGYEYIDLGRFWQISLFAGLGIWLTLMTRALLPALKGDHDHRPVIMVLFLSSIAIGLFYGVGLFAGKHTHLAMAEYWRWWVVHLWVEGFFETFAVAVVSLMFVRLGLVRAKSANSAVLFTTLIFLTGGILGTLHHLYFTGAPTSVISWGAVFSALEVVPLTLIGFEAFQTWRMRKASPWMEAYRWPIMFFVACAFWNLVGAGMLGFLINPPISLYYVQGLNTTALHSHTAFMGVYGMLGIGLMLFCTRLLAGRVWNDRLLPTTFWTLNAGLFLMAAMSLAPAGILQFNAVLEKGYWYARSPEVIHSPLMEQIVWMRMPGDILFSVGGVLLLVFFLRLIVNVVRGRGGVPEYLATETA